MSPTDDSPSALGSLLARHKAGDPGAVNAILVHCQGRLKQLTRQMLHRFPGVRRWEDTSDVFQHVVADLISTLRQLTFDSPADFLQLAACRIRWALLDLAKKRRPDLVGAGADDSAPDPVAGKPDSTNDPYNLAQWEEVHSRIDRLPPDARQLFDLLYYQDLTQAEAAEVLGVPLRTLKRKWQHARANLMSLLGNMTPF